MPAGIEPVESDQGHYVEVAGPVVTIGANGDLTWNGRPATTQQFAEGLRHDREQAKEAIAQGMAKRVPPLYVWIDRAAPAKALETVRTSAPDGTRIEVLVAGKDWSPPESDPIWVSPKVVSLRKELAGQDLSQRAATIANRISPLARQCKPLVDVFGNSGELGLNASSKGELLARGAPAALAKCGCQIDDLDLLQFGILEIMGAYQRPVRAIPLADWPPHA